MIDEVLEPLIQEDWQPRNDEMDPLLPTDVAAAIAEGWAGVGVQASITDYWDVVRYLRALESGEDCLPDRHAVLSLMSATESSLREHPMAAVILSLTAVAGWYGGEQPQHFREVGPMHMAVYGNVGWGWAEVVLPAIIVLRRADVYFTAWQLAAEAIRSVEKIARQPQSATTIGLLDRLQKEVAELEKIYWTDVQELAWDLQASIKNQHPVDCAGIAATFWAQGDPARAHAVAEGRYVPALPIISSLIDNALRGLMRANPFVWATWAQVWRPGTSLRPEDHPRLWRHSLAYRRYSADYQWVEQAEEMFEYSPPDVFAEVLVEFFSGDVNDDSRAVLQQVLDEVEPHTPSWIRIAALCTLVFAEDQNVQKRWLILVDEAAKASENQYARGTADPNDKFPDVPVYYLEGSPEDMVRCVEHHRRAGLSNSLWLTTPGCDASPDAQDLLEEERAIIDEVRALRLIMHSDRLPGRLHLRHYQQMADAGVADWYLPQRVKSRLWELYTRLHEISDQLERTAPDYFRKRLACTIEDVEEVIRWPP